MSSLHTFPQIVGALAQGGSLPGVLIYSSFLSSSLKLYYVHLEFSMAISELIQ